MVFLKRGQVSFKTFKDQVIFDKSDVPMNDRTPNTVDTHYSKKWKELLMEENYKSYHPIQIFSHRFFPSSLG